MLALEEIRTAQTPLAIGAADGSLLGRVKRLFQREPTVDSLSQGSVVVTAGLIGGVLAMVAIAASSDVPELTADEEVNYSSTGSNTTSWPQYGGSASHNPVSPVTGLPTKFDLAKKENIRWAADIGSFTIGSPVVSGGKVLIGANNTQARDPRFPASVDMACLMCFDESSGEFLWQYSSPRMAQGRRHDWPSIGMGSTPIVEGNRVWFVTNRCELVCLDLQGHHDQEDDGPEHEIMLGKTPYLLSHLADVVWRHDMFKTLGVRPLNATCVSPTIAGNLLLLQSGNDVDESYQRLAAPEAPAFLAFDKTTGQLIWSDKTPNPNIIGNGCSMGAPTVALIGGTWQAIFAGMDGWLYAFDLEAISRGETELLWKFDVNPKESIWSVSGKSKRNLPATPVVWNDKVFVATGRNPEQGDGEGLLWCIDATKRGDLSTELVYNKSIPDVVIPHKRVQACEPDKGDFTRPNPNSGVVWLYQGIGTELDGEMPFESVMHRTVGMPSIHDGLVVIADTAGILHCLDATTGKGYWTHDLLASAWPSPLIADGKIWIGDEDGDLSIFALARQKQLLAEHNLGQSICGNLATANQKLIVATKTHLIAISEVPHSEPLIAKIPGGAEIELVGVTRNAAPTHEGWKPNGSPIGEIAEWKSTRVFRRDGDATVFARDGIPHPDARDYLFEMRGFRSPPSYETNLNDTTSWNEPEYAEPYRTRLSMLLKEPTDAKKFSIKITDDRWGPYQQVGPDGSLLNKLNLTSLEREHYDKIRVEHCGPNPNNPNEGELSLRFRESQFFEEKDWGYDFELRAIGQDGKEYPTYPWNSSHMLNISTLQYLTTDHLPADKIARWEYRLRPYRHLITFENVSFEPGTKTEPIISMESLEPRVLSATLPDGSVLELLGMTTPPIQVKLPDVRTWWQANGTQLPDPVQNPNTLALGEDKANGRQALFRLTSQQSGASLNVTSRQTKGWSNSTTNSSSSTADKPAQLDVIFVFGPINDATSTTLEVQVATAPWTTWKFDLTGAPLDAPEVTDVLIRLRSAVEVLRAGPSEDGVALWTRPFSSSNESGELKIIAVDQSGKEHFSNRSSGNGQENLYGFGVRPEEFDHFELRVRPFGPRVKFENVSLQPGQKTKPTVSVESITEPESISKTPPATHPILQMVESAGTHYNGGDVVQAHIGYTPPRRDAWMNWLEKDATTSLEKLPAGKHWLIAKHPWTVFPVELPLATSPLKQPPRAGLPVQKHSSNQYSGQLAVEVDDSGKEFIRVDVTNMTDEPWSFCELDLSLEAGWLGHESEAHSPLWLTENLSESPRIEIAAKRSGSFRIDWTEWVRRGVWDPMSGVQTKSGPTLPEQLPGKIWVRLGGPGFGTLPVAVTHPEKLRGAPAEIEVGMTFNEVIRIKGKHYRPLSGMGAGQLFLYYDDLAIGVENHPHGKEGGRVFRIDPASENLKLLLGDTPYADTTKDERVIGQSPAPEAQSPRIELIGLTWDRAEKNDAWHPTGEPMPVPEWVKAIPGLATPEQQQSGAKLFLYEFHGLRTQPSIYYTNGVEHEAGDEKLPLEGPYKRAILYSHMVLGEPTWSGHPAIRLSDEPWGPWQTVTKEGKLAEPLSADAMYRSGYEKMTFHGVRPLKQSRQNGAPLPTGIPLAVIQRQPQLFGEQYAIEIESVSTGNGSEPPQFLPLNRRFFERFEIGATQDREDEFDWPIDPSKIDHFRFRIRPYRHRFEFQNINYAPSQQPSNYTEFKTVYTKLEHDLPMPEAAPVDSTLPVDRPRLNGPSETRARLELERLVASEPQYIHATRRATANPNGWKWSVYLPPGKTWHIYCQSGLIPRWQAIEPSDEIAEILISRKDEQRIIELEANAGPDSRDNGKFKMWVEADRSILQGLDWGTWEISPEIVDRITGRIHSSGQIEHHIDIGGVNTQKSERSKNRLILTHLRYREPDDRGNVEPEFMPGFCLWIQADPDMQEEPAVPADPKAQIALVQNLSSPDQKARDQAAAQLKLLFKTSARETWQAKIDAIPKNAPRAEVLAKLGIDENKDLYGAIDSMEQYRLDDTWTARIWFTSDLQKLNTIELQELLHRPWVAPPADFTGTWVTYYVNGVKAHEIDYRNGKYHGRHRSYHSNGRLLVQQHYTDHVANGEDTGYYVTGKLMYRGLYENDKQVGTWIHYNEDGTERSRTEHPLPHQSRGNEPFPGEVAPLPIEIQVVDAETGKPIADAEVTLRQVISSWQPRRTDAADAKLNISTSIPEFRTTATTNATGQFSFTIPRELRDWQSDLQISIRHPDYVIEQSFGAFQVTPEMATNPELLKEKLFPSGDIKLNRGHEISGLILSPDGKPAVGVKLYAAWQMPQYLNMPPHAVTDSDGRYKFRTVKETESDHIFVIPQDAVAVSFPLRNQYGEHSPIRLERGTVISGQVLDKDGKPLAGAVVQANGSDSVYDGFPKPMARVTTDAEGRYTLPPQKLPVDVRVSTLGWMGGWEPRRRDLTMDEVFMPVMVRDKSQTAKAPDADASGTLSLTLDFRPCETVALTALVYDEKGQPATDCELAVFGTAPDSRRDGDELRSTWRGRFHAVADQPGLFQVKAPKGLVNATLVDPEIPTGPRQKWTRATRIEESIPGPRTEQGWGVLWNDDDSIIVGEPAATAEITPGADASDSVRDQTPVPGDWGDSVDGLRLRLRPLLNPSSDTPDQTVGHTVAVALEIENLSDKSNEVSSSSVFSSGTLRITGPDGQPCLDVRGPFSTLNRPLSIAPGQIKSLVDGEDIAEQFLMTQPGEYIVQATIRVGTTTMSTGELRLTLHDGPVAPVRQIYRSMLSKAPAGSLLLLVKDQLWIFPSGLVKSDDSNGNLVVKLWHSQAPQFAEGDFPDDVREVGGYGATEGAGHWYAEIPNEVQGQWATAQQDILNVCESFPITLGGKAPSVDTSGEKVELIPELGLRGVPVSADEVRVLGVTRTPPVPGGVRITAIDPGGYIDSQIKAGKLKFAVGDVIHSVAARDVTAAKEVSRNILATRREGHSGFFIGTTSATGQGRFGVEFSELLTDSQTGQLKLPPLAFHIVAPNAVKEPVDESGYAWFPIGGDFTPKRYENVQRNWDHITLPVEKSVGDRRLGLVGDSAATSIPWDGSWHVERCELSEAPNDPNQFVIKVTLDSHGAELLRKLTTDHLREQLAIVVEERIVLAPTIMSVIGNRLSIAGNFTKAEGEQLVQAIRRGMNREVSSAETPNLQMPWRAKGRVVDGDGKPLAGVTVWAATGMGSLRGGGSGVTDADGRYDFRFGPGFLAVTAKGEPDPDNWQVAIISARLDGYFEKNHNQHGDGYACLKSVELNDDFARDMGYESLKASGITAEKIALPDRPREVDFVMLPAAKVSGILIGEDNQPLKDYSVMLTGETLPPGSEVIARVKTDENGRFQIRDIPTTVPYQFVVRKPGKELMPPWEDSWASEPMMFHPPGDNDIAIARNSSGSELTIGQRLVLQIHGSGIHPKQAIADARLRYEQRQKDRTADGLADQQELRTKELSLTLSNETHPD